MNNRLAPRVKPKKAQINATKRPVPPTWTLQKKWDTATLDAHLQALTGDDWPTVVDKVAYLIFAVGYAAHLDKLPASEPLHRVHACAHALCAAVAKQGLTNDLRVALSDGLAALRHVPITERSRRAASVHVHMMVVTRGVYWEDFQKWL